MKDLEYTKPVLEEADFGKFVAGGSVDGDGDGEHGDQIPTI